MLAKSLAKNDPKNPLLSDIETQLYEIEDMLARIEPENGKNNLLSLTLFSFNNMLL